MTANVITTPNVVPHESGTTSSIIGINQDKDKIKIPMSIVEYKAIFPKYTPNTFFQGFSTCTVEALALYLR